MRDRRAYKGVIALILLISCFSTIASPLAAGRQPSEISIRVSDPKVRVGDFIRVSGRIRPSVSGAEVQITYFRPDGSTVNRTATTFIFSIYEDILAPDMPGLWSVMASWRGNEKYEGAVSGVASFMAEEPMDIRIW